MRFADNTELHKDSAAKRCLCTHFRRAGARACLHCCTSEHKLELCTHRDIRRQRHLSSPFMAGLRAKELHGCFAIRGEGRVYANYNHEIHPWQDTSRRHHEECFAWPGEAVRHCVVIAGDTVELRSPRRGQESYCIVAPCRRSGSVAEP